MVILSINNIDNNLFFYIINLIYKYKTIAIFLLIIFICCGCFILYFNKDNSKELINYLELKDNDVVTIYKNSEFIAPGYDIYYKKRDYNDIILIPQTRANTYLNMDELMELINYIANS